MACQFVFQDIRRYNQIVHGCGIWRGICQIDMRELLRRGPKGDGDCGGVKPLVYRPFANRL